PYVRALARAPATKLGLRTAWRDGERAVHISLKRKQGRVGGPSLARQACVRPCGLHASRGTPWLNPSKRSHAGPRPKQLGNCGGDGAKGKGRSFGNSFRNSTN